MRKEPDIRWENQNGIHKIWRFKNGLGASVIKTTMSYGGESGFWELAVIRFFGEDTGSDWELEYGTPITSDVLGWLDDAAVLRVLARIEAL